MVEKKRSCSTARPSECDVITKDATNYIKMRSLQQAGFTIGYDAVRKVRASPHRSAARSVPDCTAEVQEAVDTVQEVAGLEEQTIEYLLRYQYGEQLIEKLAKLCRSKSKSPSVFC